MDSANTGADQGRLTEYQNQARELFQERACEILELVSSSAGIVITEVGGLRGMPDR